MPPRSSPWVRRVRDLPDLVLLDDLACLLRSRSSTLRRPVRGSVFPVPPLPAVDIRRRFSRAAVGRCLARGGGPKLQLFAPGWS